METDPDKRQRIVFFGTPDFATYILRALVEHREQVVAVVTAPDRPAGRGHRLRHSSVKEYAVACGIPVLQPERLTDEAFLSELKALEADLFVVVAFRMLPEQVWAMPPKGTFNLHASLLPRYRGAAPIQRAILSGETETGVTTFMLDHEIDTGQIILQEKVSIRPRETGGSLHDKLMHVGAEVVLRTIELLACDGQVLLTDQKEIPQEPCHAPKIFKADRLLSFRRSSAEEIDRRVRAMSPYPAALATLVADGTEQSVKLYEVEPLAAPTQREPGTIEVQSGRGEVIVYAAEGALSLLRLQMPNRQAMSAKEIINGRLLTEEMTLL